MNIDIRVYGAVRYNYLEGVVPLKPVEYLESSEPSLVPTQSGAIGFNFARIMEFELPDGEVVEHLSVLTETYYWGQEISVNDLTDSPDLDAVLSFTDCDRFCLTAWGALIPLFDDEVVIEYPLLLELPEGTVSE